MRVLGKDKTEQAYRVAIDLGGTEVVALVPDALLSAQYGQDGKVPHQDAYEWIDARQHDLHAAIVTLQKGGTPAAPFDQISLDAS